MEAYLWLHLSVFALAAVPVFAQAFVDWLKEQ